MTKIQIAYDVSEAAVARVRALLEDVALRDSVWNGADFHIERADFTCMPDNDGDDADALFRKIQSAINDETE
ncbi:hypothetical protein [Pseudomonas sp. MWU12-2323]|uniref:hypothetical protein n=1 Tax=Pseudomonas sp. MWU12-2323 TaxID=2651296 RepID=UPI00128ADE3F|nr:hypothetical protein [Pseudomonas sp. MWU12-2323]MPQ71481.1 hypothetical protein [Pseudomonas sp. MWU12-2323]